ncbi:hypothetical protein CGI80_05030, partial [Vibrio parahaemolyticus]|uniref:hypothetical protein n=1 Tax=Vibrio parahaemolyticus TaxID=670 RepID=UPI00116F26EC
INELNILLDEIEFKNQSIQKQYVRYALEERLKNDQELRLIVLKLRTAAKREFLEAIEIEQDGLWICYLIMIKADVVVSQSKKPCSTVK